MMYAYIDPICGKPAFLIDHVPSLGETAASRGVHHLDGRPMEFLAKRLCESCYRPMPEMPRARHLRAVIGALE